MNDLNTNNGHRATNQEIHFNQLIIVDYILKQNKTNKRKYAILKSLLDIMPTNVELVKWFANYCIKENPPKVAIQILYDHLNIHSIANDSLWIL